MPRRKASTKGNTSTIDTSLKPHKRQLSSSATTSPASRQSKRIKASAENTPTTNGKKATRKESKYFEGPNSDDEDHVQEEQDESEEVEQEETSGYEDEEVSATLPSSPSASEEEDASESDDPRPRRAHKKKQQQVKNPQAGKLSTTNAQSIVGGIMTKGKELWRQGVKVGLGPGKEVFIEKPKPRGDGGVKYVPDRIHPNTMAFLADLDDNNEREWMKSEWRFLVYVLVCYDQRCGSPTVHARNIYYSDEQYLCGIVLDGYLRSIDPEHKL